ncbi:uncharacterized protein DNG_07079 [Cephalotrichum gorgonifer]|uniref:Cu_bind_like domain-containing protein n=1 Tax=Cephalotrichum gorgonifer TaxID=2041049 RepID=A0AAE8SX61_9PEZI|nr:uncharacterized protein DNG_07079 [Cephalotrichum gorgonifer]
MRYLPALLAVSAVPALADTIKITVSDDSFDPETATAEKGDILEFHFGAGNHSVAAGEFDSINGPCVPSNEGGFFSGYFDVNSGESDEVFRVTVNDTEPIVFYSTQGRECAGGLIGGVNIKDKGQLEKYREDAAALSQGVAPPKVFGGVVAKAGSDSSDDGDDDSSDNNDGGDDDGDDDDGAAGSVRAGLAGVVGAAGLVAALMV